MFSPMKFLMRNPGPGPRWLAGLAIAGLAFLASGPGAAAPPAAALQNTAWRLVEIQSTHGAPHGERPRDSSRYTLRLQADGTASLRLDCNQAQGSWSLQPGDDPSSGGFRFGPLATTMALCPPPSLGDSLGSRLGAVRGYRLLGRLLSLTLQDDTGSLLWEPLPSAEVSARNSPDPALESSLQRSLPGYRRAVVGNDESRWARYVHAAIDLDGDGREEVFVYLMGSPFCGSGGCNLQLYRPTGQGYSLLADFPTSRLPLVVSSSRSQGWLDLWRLQSGGGAPATYVRHGFDGARYQQLERIPAESGPPPGITVLSGDPSLEVGALLRPGA